LSIAFVYEIKNLNIKRETELKSWIKKVIEEEKRYLGEITIVFVNEEKVIEINKNFLNHNYPTDVITFDKSFLNTLNGDIIIAFDIVKRNAKTYSRENVEKELHRVLIHGILHLIGYNDKNMAGLKEMRQIEDRYLTYLE